RRHGPAATTRREGKRDRHRAAPLELWSLQAPARIRSAVDTDGIDEGLVLANQLFHFAKAGLAGSVVAIGEQDQSLLAILPRGRNTDRLCNRIVHRRGAVSRDAVE